MHMPKPLRYAACHKVCVEDKQAGLYILALRASKTSRWSYRWRGVASLALRGVASLAVRLRGSSPHGCKAIDPCKCSSLFPLSLGEEHLVGVDSRCAGSSTDCAVFELQSELQ